MYNHKFIYILVFLSFLQACSNEIVITPGSSVGRRNNNNPPAGQTDELSQSFQIKGYSSCILNENKELYCLGAINEQVTFTRMLSSTADFTTALHGKSLDQITSGYMPTCVIDSLGDGYCWGSGGYGLLGNGDTADSSLPVKMKMDGYLNGKTLKKIVAGSYVLSCAIASDDLPYCWGTSSFGGLGAGMLNQSSNEPYPVSTAGALSGKTVTDISVGQHHACALASDQQVYCWGYGAQGQLGQGANTNSAVPLAVSTGGALSGKDIKSLVTGSDTTCVIADDLPYCWGNNGLAFGNAPVALSMAGVLAGKTIKKISVGGSHLCAIASDDLGYCWGDNSSGQLGDGGIGGGLTPVAVDMSGVLSGKTLKEISSGSGTTCVIASDDLLYCWGANAYGKIGDGTKVDSNIPVAVNMAGALNGKTFKAISVGMMHSCALANDDKPYCWGNGPLGAGVTGGSSLPLPVYTYSNPTESLVVEKFSMSEDTIYVTLDNGNIYILKSDGSVVAFSDERAGILDGRVLKDIAVGSTGACAIAEDNNLGYCWGSENILGDGTGEASGIPVLIDASGVLSGKTFKKIMVGYEYGCAIASDDLIYCWGYNTAGVLGDGSNTDSYSPVAVVRAGGLSGKTFSSFAAGYQHACALASDEEVYCWGQNTDGQLGDGTNTDSNIPVGINRSGSLNGKNIQSIYAGTNHNCLLNVDNSLFCWGYNQEGQLGNNSTTSSNVPVQVSSSGVLSGGVKILVMSLGSISCGMDVEENFYCWGDNSYGQIDNTFTNYSEPVLKDSLN